MTRCLDCGADRTADQCFCVRVTSAAPSWSCGGGWCGARLFFLVGIIVFNSGQAGFSRLLRSCHPHICGPRIFLSLALVTGSIFVPGNGRKWKSSAHLLRNDPVSMDFCGVLFAEWQGSTIHAPFVFPLPLWENSPRMVCAQPRLWLVLARHSAGRTPSRWIKMTTIVSSGRRYRCFSAEGGLWPSVGQRCIPPVKPLRAPR